jgi:AcrR family transcriptional regulator
LAAALTEFGRNGFDRATARGIAETAGVPVALINYHYGSKGGLYRAVFEERAPAIHDQRVAGLRLARTERDPARRIELIVKALIWPMLGLRNDPGGQAFGRILAREMSNPSSEGRGIFADMFDPIAGMMMEAIAECFPDWSEAEVHWAYHTMLGPMMIVMMDTGRIARLSNGAVSSDNVDEAATHICAILTAGLRFRDRTQDGEPGEEPT